MRGARSKKHYCASLIVSLFGFVLASPGGALAERLPLRTYTTADGLGHNNVNRIVRDSRGFLWFCTFEGLSRFDGYGFTTYGVDHGLPSPVINDLLETREGQYWVATGAGLCRFNPKGRPWSVVRSPSSSNQNNSLQPPGSGQPTTDDTMFTVYFPDEDAKSKEVISLLQDHAGTIWCGTAHGLYRLEQQAGQVMFRFIELGMPAVYGENRNVTSTIEDRRGALWIGSSSSGIYRLLPDGRTEHYSDRHGLPSNYVNSLLEDREGRLWAGTRGSGGSGLCRLVSDPDPTRPVVARTYTEQA